MVSTTLVDSYKQGLRALRQLRRGDDITPQLYDRVRTLIEPHLCHDGCSAQLGSQGLFTLRSWVVSVHDLTDPQLVQLASGRSRQLAFGTARNPFGETAEVSIAVMGDDALIEVVPVRADQPRFALAFTLDTVLHRMLPMYANAMPRIAHRILNKTAELSRAWQSADSAWNLDWETRRAVLELQK